MRFLAGVAILAISAGVAFAQPLEIALPEQSLAESLTQLSQRIGENILFQPSMMAGIRAPALKGRMTPQEAIQKLIQGTGFQAQSDGRGGVVIARESVRKSPADQNAPAAQAGISSGPALDATPFVSKEVEMVVVTGTMIRGAAPTGSNLMTVTQAEIANIGATSLTEMAAAIPSLENFGSAGRATANAADGKPGQALYIHGLGANGSSSTLVLVDGHRMPASGLSNFLVDPNNIPENMVERVEVLAEGASSVYGSDAVAGVVNFITRQHFDGVQLNIQENIADSTNSWRASALAGKSWSGGSAVLSFTYSHEKMLRNTARPWTDPLVQPARAAAAGLSGTGVTNFGNFNCDPATVQPGGVGNVHLSPTAASAVANIAANQNCSTWAYGALLPLSKRLNTMIRVNQTLSDKLTFTADLTYSSNNSTQPQSSGTLTATAFATGVQANPFYVNPPGVTATRQQIRYNFDQLLGPGAQIYGSDAFFMGHAELTYEISDTWSVTFLAMGGQDRFAVKDSGLVSQPAALLALNGTTQASGVTTTNAIPGYTAVTAAGTTTNNTSVPGFNAVVLNLPLTTANALDVWNPAATNRTSARTIAGLTNAVDFRRAINSLVQFRAAAQGPIFALPAGQVKVAVGIEALTNNINTQRATPSSTAPTLYAGLITSASLHRTDLSEYVEVQIPVVAPHMDIPLVAGLNVSASVRHDHYSDFGGTTNPKLSLDWRMNDELKLRGNISTSFVAPPQSYMYDPYGGAASRSSLATIGTATVPIPNLPVALYPSLTQMGIAGCTASSASCPISSLQGLTLSTGDSKDTAAEGRGWTAGFDYTPSRFLRGLSLSVTYWVSTYLHGTTGGTNAVPAIINNPASADQMQLFPGCATPAQIAAIAGGATVTSAYPSCVQYVWQAITSNYLNYWVRGIDANAHYTYDLGDWGVLSADENLAQILKFDEGYCRHCTPTKAQLYNALNLQGVNSSFMIMALQSRAHIGWQRSGFHLDGYVNWTNGYRNGMSPVNAIVSVNRLFDTGGDHVPANVTFDLHASYNFATAWAGSTQDSVLSLTVRNLADTLPPYYNSVNGYDLLQASPVGRKFVIGLQTKL